MLGARLQMGQMSGIRTQFSGLQAKHSTAELSRYPSKTDVTYSMLFFYCGIQDSRVVHFLQIRNEYMRQLSETIDQSTAIRLGCIEMRRFFKNMSPEALLKKSNMEYIEKVGDLSDGRLINVLFILMDVAKFYFRVRIP